MRIEGRERVPLPREEVWARLNDPDVLRRCTPGLERLEVTGPDRYEAMLEVRLPAITARFNGSVDFLEREEPERMRMKLRGKGPAGFVEGEVELRLTPLGGGTEVSYTADVQVGGQVARLGQRMISGVTQEMARQFFDLFGRPEEVSTPGPWRAFWALIWRVARDLLGLSPRS